MTTKEAIKARIDRFNELWIKATGHSFEEDPQWCADENAKEMPAWEAEMKEVLSKHGFDSVETYLDGIHANPETHRFEGFIDEIENVRGKRPHHTSLYGYEMMVINDAERTVEFVESLGGYQWWNKNTRYKNITEIEKALKEHGYVTDEGHSGNSFSMMLMYTSVLLENPEWFPYLHGALSPLVGDEGYHDDRSDVPMLKG